MKKYYTLFVLLLFSQNIFAQGPWNFNNDNDIWAASATTANFNVASTYGILDVNGAGNPQIKTTTANINADNLFVIIKLRNNTSNELLRVIYNTSGTNRFVNKSISKNDKEVKTYVIKMNSNADWNGIVDTISFQFRKSSSDTSAAFDDGLGNIFIENIEFTKHYWTFQNTQGGWSRSAGDTWSTGTNASTLTFTAAQNFPGIKITDPIIGNDNPYAYIKLKNNSTRTTLRVRFFEDGTTNSEQRAVTISTNDTDFKTYRINMSSNGLWNTATAKTDVQVSLTNSVLSAGNIEIDDIQFGSFREDDESFNFNGNSDITGFTGGNGVTVSSDTTDTGKGYVKLAIIANNSAKFESKTKSNGGFPVDASSYKGLVVTLINATDNEALAFVSKDGEQKFSFATMDPGNPDDKNGPTQEVVFTYLNKDNWTGSEQDLWFLRPRTSSSDPEVKTGSIYIQSIKFIDNTTPVISIADGDWDNASTWWGDEIPDGFISGFEMKRDVQLDNQVNTSSFQKVNNLNISPGSSFISTSTFQGTVNYTRTLTTTNWYLISSPVSGQDIDTFVAASNLATGTQENNVGFSNYDNTSESWTYYQSGASGTGNFNLGQGHAVKLSASGSVSFSGSFNDANVSTSLTNNTNGFNLIGNPYTSYISVSELLNENSGGLLSENTIWLWDQSANAGAGGYIQKNLAADLEIAPGQGFFVLAGSAGTFDITEAMQSSSADTFFTPSSNRPEINLTLTNESETRAADIYYIDGTTTGFDNGYDSSIFGGFENEFAIYTHEVTTDSGRNLGIQSLPDNDYENMIIPVGINATSGMTISISASSVNLPAGIKLYLQDTSDNSFTLLENDSKFTTTLTSDLNGSGRFYLYTALDTLGIDSATLNDMIGIYTPTPEQLRIVGVQSGAASVVLYNTLGKQVLKTAFQGQGANNIALPTLASGVYVIKLTTESGIINRKIILN